MRIDMKEILGGAVLIGIGAFAAIVAPRYGIGSPTHMGAGFFPLVLGLLAIALGLGVALPALFRSGAIPEVSWRPLIAVSVAIAAFAIITRFFGYLPGVAAATVLAALGDKRSTPLGIVLLALGVTVAIWLIFTVGLRFAPQAIRGF